jgi:hypothetical protein
MEPFYCKDCECYHAEDTRGRIGICWHYLDSQEAEYEKQIEEDMARITAELDAMHNQFIEVHYTKTVHSCGHAEDEIDGLVRRLCSLCSEAHKQEHLWQ